MTLALLAMSHSPLLEFADLDADVTAELDQTFAAAKDFVHDYDPDIVVNFAPDHYNGFFYNLMPPYCVGYAATSIGDYGSQAGRARRPGDKARSLAEAIIAEGIDLSVSLADGGRPRHRPADGDRLRRHHRQAVHPHLHQLRRPALHPRQAGPAARRGLGRHLATWDEKVLLISSGGLSHDPPVPRLATATPASGRCSWARTSHCPLRPARRVSNGSSTPPATSPPAPPTSRTWPPSGTRNCCASSPPATSPRSTPSTPTR